MTEYKHVTEFVEVVGEAKINLSKTRLFVDVNARGWVRANKLVENELAKGGDKSFYKVGSRKFLWEQYFHNANEVHTLEFWEGLLEDMSNKDGLDVHSEIKAVIRKTLMEVISCYINENCVLLPMVAPSSKETPVCHLQEFPKLWLIYPSYKIPYLE